MIIIYHIWYIFIILWTFDQCVSINLHSHKTAGAVSLVPENLRSNQLILISGCTGTGKSTFGMEISISRGILKCISTDTIRQIMRTYNKEEPALQRSSYAGEGKPIENWLETCRVLEDGVDNIVDDSLRRGTSLVLEGVHIEPNQKLLQKWRTDGGTALGVVLCIPDEETHYNVLYKRGVETTKGAADQLRGFRRIREIHDEMVRLGRQENWFIIEQKPLLEPRAIDLLNNQLNQVWIDRYSQGILRNPLT